MILEQELLHGIKNLSIGNTCLRGGIHITMVNARKFISNKVVEDLYAVALLDFYKSFPTNVVSQVNIAYVLGRYIRIRKFLLDDRCC